LGDERAAARGLDEALPCIGPYGLRYGCVPAGLSLIRAERDQYDPSIPGRPGAPKNAVHLSRACCGSGGVYRVAWGLQIAEFSPVSVFEHNANYW